MRCRLCLGDNEVDPTYGDVCDSCGLKIARRFRERMIWEDRQVQDAKRQKEREAKAERARREAAARPALAESLTQRESVVYYVRIADHVKIGYSKNLINRLHALRVEVSDVLAIEPGGRSIEQQRHEQFGHLRIKAKWENFTPGDDLDTHIKALRDEFGIPVWLTPPRTNRRALATPVVVRVLGDASS